jgi:hypothetical protein
VSAPHDSVERSTGTEPAGDCRRARTKERRCPHWRSRVRSPTYIASASVLAIDARLRLRIERSCEPGINRESARASATGTRTCAWRARELRPHSRGISRA